MLLDALRKLVAGEPVREAAGASSDPLEEPGFTRLTADAQRDMAPLTRARMLQLAPYLWRSNPLANRLIELPIAYMLSEGVTIKVEDDDAQRWLKRFWADPINCMDLKLVKKVRELALYGEQCWPVFINDVNGDVRLGYIDPARIEKVVTDPDNSEQPIGIILRRDAKHRKKKYRVIVNGPETVFGDAARRARRQFTDGDCFYWTINSLSNQADGMSDLLPSADWLDGLDSALFGDLDRWEFLRNFVWDVTIEGADQEELDRRAKTDPPPKPGAVRYHNEREKWDAVAPTLGTGDTEAIARTMRNHVLGGGTIPEHWYGSGGDVNRAVGAEMQEPTFRIFSMRQRLIKYILEQVATFVILTKLRVLQGATLLPDEAEELGFIPQAVFPELVARDTAKYAAAFAQTVVAVATAMDRNLLTRDQGVAILVAVAARLGVEMTVDDVVAQLDAAAAETPPPPGFAPDVARPVAPAAHE